MVFNCNINAFSNLTSIIYLYNENMNLEMTIKKIGSAHKFRVGRATGNEHIFLFGLMQYLDNYISDFKTVCSIEFSYHGFRINFHKTPYIIFRYKVCHRVKFLSLR